MPETYPDLLLAQDGPVVTITLNRPERLNAFTGAMQLGLARLCHEIEEDGSVRAVILTGAGRGFCAGGDVKGMFESRVQGSGGPPIIHSRPLLQPWGEITLAIRNLSKPVIAAVNGAAAGAGCDLALACDIRLASESARFGETFVKIGLVPDQGGMYLLPRLVGLERACELIFTGEVIDAQEALRIGLVSRVVSADALLETARELALRISQNAPLAVRLAKRGIYAAQESTLRDALDFVASAQLRLQQTTDHKEGVRAFVEKRPPDFTGQ